MAINPRARVLVIATVVFAALAALIWFLSVRYWPQPVTPLPTPDAASEAITTPPAATPPAATPPATPPVELTPQATPASSPSATPTPSPAIVPTPQATPAVSTQTPAHVSPSGLVIPVAGVRPDQLQDTFNAARSEGRVHDAIDIMAPRNTPVLAAADGRVVKLFQSVKGGTTIYQLGTDERTVYYYAHLERYADGLQEGHVARRGEIIGYVGDTGNAAPGNTHLHFQIYTITDPKHFWDGTNLNPYTLLR